MTATPTASTTVMLDVADVAEMLHCSRRHIYRLSDSGRMPPPIRLGALVRLYRDMLMRLIVDGCPPVRRAGRPAR
jgi:excisionase family DNA binding protein